jgi:hypothetical protein
MANMKNKIELETKVKNKIIDKEKFLYSQYFLKVNGANFDQDEDSEQNRNIQDAVSKDYWKNISKFYDPKLKLIVKLSGLHFNYEEFVEKYSGKIKKNIIIFHKIWDLNSKGWHDDYSSVLIECDLKLFKELFKLYWFALSFELQFEGIIVKPNNLPKAYRWYDYEESTNTKKGFNELMKTCLTYFDNEENGFHYRVISQKDSLQLRHQIKPR